MPAALKFKIDQNLPAEAAELLVRAGYDALTVNDQKLGGAEDDRIAAICRDEGRALVTLDLDFADIRQYPQGNRAGVLVLRLAAQDKDHVLSVLQRVVA